jgi:hypothetical protein
LAEQVVVADSEPQLVFLLLLQITQLLLALVALVAALQYQVETLHFQQLLLLAVGMAEPITMAIQARLAVQVAVLVVRVRLGVQVILLA